jgi:novobiocin biosynthesis protein NovU/D-mycarose 3-C-methyltransferase
METIIPLAACRICNEQMTAPFLSLGMMPNINKFLRSAADAAREKKYPLEVARCPRCSHVQLTCALSPEETFGEYLYFSSMSDAFVAHGRELAACAHETARLRDGDFVVEIASNDGAVLQSFVPYTKNILGIEPARNIAQVANERGIRTLPEFFSNACAKRLRSEYGAARVIVGTNVLAHVLDLKDFVSGIRELLHPDGLVLIEVPYVRDLLSNFEFDTIYHEHLSYFNLTALFALFTDAGLRITDVRIVPIHGGSLLLCIRHAARLPYLPAGERHDVYKGAKSPRESSRCAHRVCANRRL